jgi:hypothetical protein
MPVGLVAGLAKREASRDSLSLSITLEDCKQEGGRLCVVTPAKCGICSRKIIEPGHVCGTPEGLGSINLDGCEPDLLALNIDTGSYRSFGVCLSFKPQSAQQCVLVNR